MYTSSFILIVRGKSQLPEIYHLETSPVCLSAPTSKSHQPANPCVHSIHSAPWQNRAPFVPQRRQMRLKLGRRWVLLIALRMTVAEGMFCLPLQVDDEGGELDGYGLFMSQLPWAAKMLALALGVSCWAFLIV